MQDIIEVAQSKQMEYFPFKFPIGANKDETRLVFLFSGAHKELLLTKDGMTMLLQHLYEHVDRTKAKAYYRSGQLKEFAAYINHCRTTQVNERLWRKEQQYFLAWRDDHVFGVLAHYNPKSNAEVLTDIKNAGLSGCITDWSIQAKEMNVYLEYASKAHFELGLNVRNGETGHATLSYRAYVKQGEYTFSTAKFGKRRHMNNLGLVEQDLGAVYGELSDLLFYDFIMDSEALEFASLILQDESFDKLHELVQPYQSRLKKLYSLLGFLNTQRDTKGWKTVCTKALDKVYNAIMEVI